MHDRDAGWDGVMLADLLSGAAAIIVTLLVLFVLVIVHEVGHFIVARRFGVKVHEFGIGFPPRARILGSDGDTLYTLNWLPIGGFVRLEGEDGGNRRDPRSFAAQSLGRRIIILASGVAMNLVLALVVFSGVAATADPSVVLHFADAAPGTLAANIGLAPGDVIERIDGHRFAYFDQEDPVAALSARVGEATKLTIRHADGIVEERTVELGPGGGMRISLVQDDSPAAAAGLVAGDVILAIDGRPVSFLERVAASSYLREHAGQQVVLSVEHAGGRMEELTVTLRDAAQIAPDRGALGVRFDPGNVGLQPGPAIPHDLAGALQKGGQRTVQALSLTVGALGALIGSIVSDPTAAPPVAGPVGITFAIGSLLQSYPPIFLLWLTGVLSASLAFLNIVPYPPLDGGRIAMAVLQAVAGNRISQRIERLVYFLGFTVLIGLLLWVTWFDVLRGSQLMP